MTTPVIRGVHSKPLEEGAARASVNRELAYLRRGFKLMLKAGDISAIPAVIELLQGENVRKGFVAPAEFASLSEKIADADARDLVAFLYNAGWRSGEGKSSGMVGGRFEQEHDSTCRPRSPSLKSRETYR